MSDCIFDEIAAGKIPSDVVYQDDSVIAFKDLHPKAPVHVLIIPKKHIASLLELSPADNSLIGHMLEVANVIAKKNGLKGYKIVINTGPEAGQVVMHLHMHFLGGRKISSPV